MCWVIGSAAFSVERLKRFSKGSKNLEFVCFFHWGFLKTTPNTHFFSFLFCIFFNYSLESNNVFKNNFLNRFLIMKTRK